MELCSELSSLESWCVLNTGFTAGTNIPQCNAEAMSMFGADI